MRLQLSLVSFKVFIRKANITWLRFLIKNLNDKSARYIEIWCIENHLRTLMETLLILLAIGIINILVANNFRREC